MQVMCFWAVIQIGAAIPVGAVGEKHSVSRDSGEILLTQPDTENSPDTDSKMKDIVEKKSASEDDDKGIRDIAPRKKQKISVAEALAVDLALPGGGALYYKNYYYGAGFAALKIAGIYGIYYYYKDWEFKRSLYYSARRANNSMDPDHELQFKVPGGGYKTVRELKQDYDRSAQRITFSVIATTAVYAASLLFTWHEVDKMNESAIPTFEIAYSCDRLESRGGGNLALFCTLRI